MGQVAMANSHGGFRIEQTSGVGCSIDGQLLGLPKKDLRRGRVGCSLPRMEQEVGDVSGSWSKDVRMPCMTATQSIFLKYYEW